MSADWHRVARSDQLADDAVLACEAAGIPLALARIAGHVYAVEDRCPHMAYPLHHGVVREGRLVCTWHHWEFDLPRGQRFVNERAVCATYPTREADQEIWVRVDPQRLPPAPGGFPRPGLDPTRG